MKICFIASDVNEKSGLGRVVHALAKELAHRGHTIGIVSNESILGFDSCPVSVKASYKSLFRTFADVLRMRRFFKKYDVLVTFDVRPAGILTYIASYGLGKKIIVHALGTYALFEEKSILKNYLINKVYSSASKVFVINPFVRKCIEESNSSFSFGTNLAYVPVGVDTSLFKKNPHPSYTYAQEYILSVGAIKERKGQLKSVQAFIKLADVFPQLHYIIVGDIYEHVGYINKIREEIRKANVTHRVHFLQKINDTELMDLYSGAQFFVLTPTTTKEAIEGFGLVYLEAALCGATAIGTWGTGAEAAIEHQKSGLLSGEDITELSNIMKQLLQDESKRKSYAEYARERALMYDWKEIANEYEKNLV